ncbi:glycosyltransferase family 2 protein [Methylophaga sp.]|uniref:glycosyltransferase family 2 protein n=1 Tax=Methylophaga sp. TaxID=2024840 RepID=UPI003A94A2C0
MEFESFSADIVIPFYNNWRALCDLVVEIERCLDKYPSIKVFAIDDGSTDSNSEVPGIFSSDSRFSIITHPQNRGRASALNTGLFAGESRFVIFLDVDCTPQYGWLDHFYQGACSGYDCVFGNLRAEGKTYWSRYLNETYEKKARAYISGSLDFITPFCMLRRDLLQNVGGFCEEYTRYGFEDRDLIQRLLTSVEINPLFLESVYATHSVPKSLDSVLRKASEAGEFSAKIFSRQFPSFYRKQSYWYFDAREHSAFYGIGFFVIWFLIDRNILWIKSLMEREMLPYVAWRFFVKLSSGLAFFYGTLQGRK